MTLICQYFTSNAREFDCLYFTSVWGLGSGQWLPRKVELTRWCIRFHLHYAPNMILCYHHCMYYARYQRFGYVVASLLSEEGLDKAVQSQTRVYSHHQRYQEPAAQACIETQYKSGQDQGKTIMFMVSWGRRSPATFAQPGFLLHGGFLST